MPIRSEYLFKVADTLLDKALGNADEYKEALERSAYSRLYYSVYNRAVEYVVSKYSYEKKRPNGSFRNGHQDIPKLLITQKFAGEDTEDLVSILETMRARRNNADYDIDDPFFIDYESAKFDAEILLEKFNELSNS